MRHSGKKIIICTILLGSYVLGSVFGADAPTMNPNKTQNSNLTYYSLYVTSQNLKSAKTKKSASAADFKDINADEWYYKYVDSLVSRNIISGTSENTFSPTSSFSIAECAAVITRYLGLENAAKETAKELVRLSTTGSELWYSGYIQLMYDIGVLRLPDFAADKDGFLSISKSICERPIKRYEFADCIARSFDLSKDNTIRALNVYPEIGGLGHEFICSGAYDMSCVNTYSLFIRDFEEIPEEYRINVLKTYYDGIFNGDINGFFYPLNNLTRAEMAKVIAAITDFSLRTKILSPSSKHITLDSSSFVTDAKGDRYIKNTIAENILLEEAKGITAGNGDITYNRRYAAPLGYAVDVYVYTTNASGVNILGAQSTLYDSDPNSEKQIFYWYGNGGKVLLVLRNLSESSRPEATLELSLDFEGIQNYSFSWREPKSILD